MIVFYGVAFPALAVCVVTAMYPERVTKLFAGNGKRRFTPASAAEAADTIRTLEMQLAAAEKRPCPNCHHLTGWPTGAELADSDRSDPAPHISAKAPVDNGSRDTPAAAAETVRDASLASIALPGEEEMAAFLEAERAKNREKAEARAEADTVTLPAVVTVKPLHQAQAELAAWALNTAPPAGNGPSEISVGMGQRISVKVRTHLDEAS